MQVVIVSHKVFSTGTHHHTIDVQNTCDEVLTLSDDSSGTLMVFVSGDGVLNLRVDVGNNANWTYLWVNESHDSLNVDEKIVLHKNSFIRANYAELTKGNHVKKTEAEFVGERSVFEFRSATLAFNRLKWEIVATHRAKYSEANLDSYAIVLEQGHLELEVIGHIEKGYNGSKTHQLTRVMNLGSELQTIVYPKLLIEENDVEASHAASVGQPDEDQIYYMQARGIPRTEALKLITLGYLLPVVHEIEDEEIKEKLRAEIELKVEKEWMN